MPDHALQQTTTTSTTREQSTTTRNPSAADDMSFANEGYGQGELDGSGGGTSVLDTFAEGQPPGDGPTDLDIFEAAVSATSSGSATSPTQGADGVTFGLSGSAAGDVQIMSTYTFSIGSFADLASAWYTTKASYADVFGGDWGAVEAIGNALVNREMAGVSNAAFLGMAFLGLPGELDEAYSAAQADDGAWGAGAEDPIGFVQALGARVVALEETIAHIQNVLLTASQEMVGVSQIQTPTGVRYFTEDETFDYVQDRYADVSRFHERIGREHDFVVDLYEGQKGAIGEGVTGELYAWLGDAEDPTSVMFMRARNARVAAEQVMAEPPAGLPENQLKQLFACYAAAQAEAITVMELAEAVSEYVAGLREGLQDTITTVVTIRDALIAIDVVIAGLVLTPVIGGVLPFGGVAANVTAGFLSGASIKATEATVRQFDDLIAGESFEWTPVTEAALTGGMLNAFSTAMVAGIGRLPLRIDGASMSAIMAPGSAANAIARAAAKQALKEFVPQLAAGMVEQAEATAELAQMFEAHLQAMLAESTEPPQST